jgi:beta-mannosidase
MKKFLLNGQWNMQGGGYHVQGNIPGSVYSFLHIDHALLPDPHYRDNEDIYLALANHEYTFERKFLYEVGGHPVQLICEGLDTLCTVYLNGQKLGDTDNMHVRYAFDVTDILISGENHVQVVCHPVPPYIKEKNAEAKLFGANDCMVGYPYVRKAHCMMGWDWGPRLPDAGIWKDIYLLEKDSAQITDFRVTQRHENGRVYLTPIVETDGGMSAGIFLSTPDGNIIFLPANIETEIKNPQLWWPNGMGEQPLYTLHAVLYENGVTLDEKIITIGLRELKLVREKDEFGESFYHEINGKKNVRHGRGLYP